MAWLKSIILALLEFLRDLAREPTTAEDADAQQERRKRLIEKIRTQKRIDEAKSRRNHDGTPPDTGRL